MRGAENITRIHLGALSRNHTRVGGNGAPVTALNEEQNARISLEARWYHANSSLDPFGFKDFYFAEELPPSFSKENDTSLSKGGLY